MSEDSKVLFEALDMKQHLLIPLDSGFCRNDKKGRPLKFVSPAKAGVQSRGFEWPDPQIDGVYIIMDSLVIDFSHQ